MSDVVPPGGDFQPARHQLVDLGPPEGGPRRTAGFALRATLTDRDGRASGRGELVISPEAVVFSPVAGSRLAAHGEFTHTGRSIPLTFSLLAPPWAGANLHLRDGDARLRVSVPIFGLRKLVRALRAAGYATSSS